jgi:hypothetical protein
MRRYASETSVPWERTRNEIEQTLNRYKCTEFGYLTAPRSALIAFRHKGIAYRLELPMPDDKARQITHDPAGRKRDERRRLAALEQETRRRWRVLLLLIKAKLEAVEIGNTTMEREFLADLVLPGGGTVGTWAVEQLRPAIEAGTMPSAILSLPEAKTG